MRIVFLCFMMFLCSCSGQWHLRKALKKDPSILVVDTVIKYDTVILELNRIDTLFRYNFDTVEFWKDSIFVSYFYDTIQNDVYLEVDCPDEKVIYKDRTVTKTVKVEPSFKEKVLFSLNWVFWGLLILGIYLFIRKIWK